MGPFFLTAHSVMSLRSTKYAFAAAAATLGLALPAANLLAVVMEYKSVWSILMIRCTS